MLRMTVRAYAIARMLVIEHGARGLRVCDAGLDHGDDPQLVIGPVGGPAADDAVIVLGDLEVYLDAVAELVLEERVLDAEPEGSGLRWEASPSVATDGAEAALVCPAEVQDGAHAQGAAPPAALDEAAIAALVAGWALDLELLARFDAYYHGRDGEHA